jgi:hypothetical protein
MAVDIQRLQAEARRRYERGRARHAALSASLLLPLLALVVAVSPGRQYAWAAVLLAWLCAFVALWRGEALGRGVIPGVVCALFPLLGSHIAARLGHVCTEGGCVSLCAPLCSAGGVAAGLVLAHWIRRERSPQMAFASGALLVVAVGATSCTCIGLSGVAGIAAGLAAGYVRVLFMRPQVAG